MAEMPFQPLRNSNKGNEMPVHLTPQYAEPLKRQEELEGCEVISMALKGVAKLVGAANLTSADGVADGFNSPGSHYSGSTDENANPLMSEEQLARFSKRQDLGDIDANEALSKVVDYINNHNLAGCKPVINCGKPGSGAALKWVQPSGPRKPGEGTENEEQGILSAEFTSHRTVVLRVTLLAAGFLIGPSGTAVRGITRQTGAEVRSWTEKANGKLKRPCRVLVIEGSTKALLHAVNVIFAAVQRYKQLAEGSCTGQSVSRVQMIMGVEFCYQPPPRSAVPCAAALKSTPNKSKSLIDAQALSQHFQLMQYNATMGNLMDLQQNLMAAQAVMDGPTYLAMLNMLQQHHLQQQQSVQTVAGNQHIAMPSNCLPVNNALLSSFQQGGASALTSQPSGGPEYVPIVPGNNLTHGMNYGNLQNMGLGGGNTASMNPQLFTQDMQLDACMQYPAAASIIPSNQNGGHATAFNDAAPAQDTQTGNPASQVDPQQAFSDLLCNIISQASLGNLDLQQFLTVLASNSLEKEVQGNHQVEPMSSSVQGMYSAAQQQANMMSDGAGQLQGSNTTAVPAQQNALEPHPVAAAGGSLHNYIHSEADVNKPASGSAPRMNSEPETLQSQVRRPSPSVLSTFSSLPILQADQPCAGQWNLMNLVPGGSLTTEQNGAQCSLAQMARLSFTDPICSPIRKAASAPKGMLDRIENIPNGSCLLTRSCMGMDTVDGQQEELSKVSKADSTEADD